MITVSESSNQVSISEINRSVISNEAQFKIEIAESDNLVRIIENPIQVSINESTNLVLIEECGTKVVTATTQGPQGIPGQGVVSGGTSGDLLVKATNADYDTAWISQSDITRRDSGPEFTYSNGDVTRIDYDSGNYKLFTYLNGNVSRIDYVRGATTIRKDFIYNLDGSLASITEVEF